VYGALVWARRALNHPFRRFSAVRDVLDTSDQVRQAAQRTRDAERPDKPKKRKKKKRKAASLKLGSSIKVASIKGHASVAEGRA
jgi:hypothetical protein